MNRRVFFLGFGLSTFLIVRCIWYAFVSPVSSAIMESFDLANRGWYVHQPGVYKPCLLAFALLNIPVMLVFWLLLPTVDAAMPFSATGRAIISFVSLLVSSGAWWALLARRRRKDHRMP
jgi:hypothetical protein